MREFFITLVPVLIAQAVNAALILFFTGPILQHFGFSEFPQSWTMFVAIFAVFLALK